MNMQLPPQVFDVSAPTPLRRVRASPPLRSHALAAAITIVAHVVAITGIIEGLRQANILHQPDVVTVHIDVPKQKPEALAPLPTPALVRPSLITAPVPLFNIAPPTDPNVAPPPTRPTASTAVPPPSTGRMTPSNPVATWQGLLLARLQEAKRYPMFAMLHRQEGVAVLHFTMDREGNVLSAEIKKSSGHELLDQETLALIHRAAPLPRPPQEVTNDLLSMDVPVNFFLPKRH